VIREEVGAAPRTVSALWNDSPARAHAGPELTLEVDLARITRRRGLPTTATRKRRR
jgi:hypothetical protein